MSLLYPSDRDTFSSLLLTLTALSGELPAAVVNRLPYAASYKTLIIKRLKKEGLIHAYSRDRLRGLRLAAAAKKQLAANAPDRFTTLFSGDTTTNAPKYTVPHRLRLHRMAEALVTMLNAGVSVYPWEKPPLFSPTPPDDMPFIERPAYFSSREVKELGALAVKIRNSRSTGVLLTDGGIFVVYNIGPGLMKWEYQSEVRLKTLLTSELCQKRLPEQFAETEQAAIVFGDSMELMPPLMGVGQDKRHNYFVIDGSFGHFHYLTNDSHGELIVQILCDLEQQEVLNELLSRDLAPRRPGWMVENDAMDGEDPVLFAYTCDMPRVQKFVTALDVHRKVGTLYCFDFQEDALRQVCGPKVNIESIDFDAYERSVFHFEEGQD